MYNNFFRAPYYYNKKINWKHFSFDNLLSKELIKKYNSDDGGIIDQEDFKVVYKNFCTKKFKNLNNNDYNFKDHIKKIINNNPLYEFPTIEIIHKQLNNKKKIEEDLNDRVKYLLEFYKKAFIKLLG